MYLWLIQLLLVLFHKMDSHLQYHCLQHQVLLQLKQELFPQFKKLLQRLNEVLNEKQTQQHQLLTQAMKQAVNRRWIQKQQKYLLGGKVAVLLRNPQKICQIHRSQL
uniref:U106-Liphistoxin-Lth1a_1 n=1 Tax=Liphistius thaleban TaxID=1905330 RepID=A0A4V6MK88_9ARAC